MFGKLFGPALKGMKQFFSTERVIIIVAFLLLIWLLGRYAKSNSAVLDQMEDGTADVEAGAEEDKTEEPLSNGSGNTANGSGYATHEVANPKDLLPADENSQWAALNPNAAKQGDATMPDLLKAGHHIGLDTIGQTLRNANLQLRSDPIISKAEVGPWNQSTIETDYARVPLELGPKK
uniref:Minor capsid protein P11 C-terminal conserved region domain-containing protein n=1 Tax=viral metagenome TaxID=1070528 RepID=A0A6C0J318_9ZZZZ